MKHTIILIMFYFFMLPFIKAQSFEYGARGFETDYAAGTANTSCIVPFNPLFGGFYTIDDGIATVYFTEEGLRMASTSNP